MDLSQQPGDARPLPTSFAYSLPRRILVMTFVGLLSVPLLTMLAFLATHPPRTGDLGPLLVALLFVLAPPLFMVLRFGHTFRRFEVRPHQLAVSTLGHRWQIEWRDVTQVIRRIRPAGTYRVRVRTESRQGVEDWVELFDSALPAADQLYAQLLHHTPQVRPKEIQDDAFGWRGQG